MSRGTSVTGRVLRLLLVAALCVVLVPVVAAGGDAAASSQKSRPLKAPSWAPVDANGHPYVPGEVLVKFKPGVTAQASSSVHAKIKARKVQDVKGVRGLQLARLPKGMSAEKAAAWYARQSAVEYAQPNYLHSVSVTPNDERFSELWGMDNWGQTGGTEDADIDAPEAWDQQTGDSSVIVAVIDTGVDYNHPDLADNIWVNPGEVPGNGIDDDGNGYVDDVHGYDFINEDPDPMDDNSHGTHCSGTIGAVADNGIGVAGVAWDVQIMALKFLSADGWGDTMDAIECINYAAMMGADIMSNSWGGGPYEQALYDAIGASGALFVAAAGNWGENTDLFPNYPSCYDLPNVLAVGATNHNDQRAEWSNWGPETVDVFAPGEDILSTVLGPKPVFTPDVLGAETVNTCDDLGDWDVSEYAVDPWALTGKYFTSDPASIAHIGYGNKEDSWAKLLSPIDLSGYTGAILRFNTFYETEPGLDELHAWISHDGVDWVELGRFSGWSDGFQQVERNISGFVGDADVYLAFSFTSDASVNSKDGFVGVAVDDIEVVEMDPLFADDFTDLAAWDASEYAQQPWALTSDWYVSAPTAVGNVNYLDNESAWLKLVDPIDLSAVTGGVALTAQALYMTEMGLDVMTAWASTDGVDWTPLARYSGFSGFWDISFVPVAIDLSAYAGAPEVYLAFSFTSNDSISGADGAIGVVIDDLAVLTGEWTEPDYTNAYEYFSGTSMATPHVAGIAALVLSEWPDATTDDLKYAIMAGADPLPQLAGRCVTGARANAYRSIQDLYPPVVTDDNTGEYTALAEITLTASDDSGVASISYYFDDDPPTTVVGDVAVARNAIPAKRHTLTYWAEDTVGNVSEPVTVEFVLRRGAVSSESVAGANRYETAVEASKKAFPEGAATVVLATGRNWPDAVCGSALAGVVDGPLLLTDTASAPSVVLNEIKRLGATSVIVLGGERSVSASVVSQLKGVVGAGGVTRIAGANRYETSALIAAEVIARHPAYDGMAFVTTGSNFPDALSVAPIATHRGWPVLLANPLGDVAVPDEVTSVLIAGGEASVSSGIEGALDGLLGDEHVVRKAGADRFGTSTLVAAWGIGQGLHWEGVGLATGARFPDALSGGVMLGHLRSPLLLTRGDTLLPVTRAPLALNKQYIQTVRFIGGATAVSNAVRTEVMLTLQ